MPVMITDTPVSSRKRSVATLSNNANSSPIESRSKIHKVSRACDICKSKKAKCSGTKPCDYCAKKRIECSYDAKYSRGRPPTPPAAATQPTIDLTVDRGIDASSEDRSSDAELPTHVPVGDSTSQKDPQTDNMNSPVEGNNPSRASPDLEVAEIEGQYFDPTSGLTFLHRAWKRLATQKSSVDNEGNEKRQMWMAAGDEPFAEKGDVSTELPEKVVSKELLSFYFDVCVVTYRFLHKSSVITWVDAMHNNIQQNLPVWNGVGQARAAIVFSILAIASIRQEKIKGIGSPDQETSSLKTSDRYFRAGSKLLTESETGLPRLESAQARLIQVLYLLQTARMNQGWYAFGSAVQIISALALHRKSGRKRNVTGRLSNADYINSQYRKRTFWVAYTIDAYLGVVFGRPRHYHDDDIDQDFPDCVNDEDMTHQGPAVTEAEEDCHVEALISHAKYTIPMMKLARNFLKLTNSRLAQIIGAISKEVYSTKKMPKSDRLAAADRLGNQLKEWKATLPAHLGRIRPSSLIPSFRRQATAMKLAHSHAVLHAYRPFLMRQTAQQSQLPLSDGVLQCLSAAKVALQTVDGMAVDGSLFHAFWWTHYVLFCALSVVYVWEIQQSTSSGKQYGSENAIQLFELAERCHSHLTREMTACSPSRRYSVILEELRLEAKHRSARNTPQGIVIQTPNAHANASSLPPNPFGQTVAGQLYSNPGDAIIYDTNPIWNEWQTGDWLDLDGSAFGPFSDTEGSPVFWFNEITENQTEAS
ncbi:hypothetical protein TWF718_009358 [Orbilia javanica]|uniref:Zn(2)-C6 fungal-type domain-containing protein n=1 Tax=Orbilia javanica TaxID=47235 RepID=A0AAN8N2V2_9PEZI